MLDIKFIRDHQELVQKGTNDKHFPVDIPALLQLDHQIKTLKQSLEDLQATRNRLSKEIGLASSSEERETKKQQVLSFKEDMDAKNQDLKKLQDDLHQMMLRVAQPAAEDVPLGKDDSQNVEIKKWGNPRAFDFEAKDHIQLGASLDMIDFERGVKIAGSRSYIFKGKGALLEQAILRMSYDYLVSKGFIPVSVPVLVNEEAMEGTGYFPLGRDQAYICERDKMALVGTSEVSLCSLHRGDVFEQKDLPLRYMAQTPCFRREAGSHGKDTKGLYRVHQFNKIEMVIFGHADKNQSIELHSELLNHAETILQKLELPYRVVYVFTGDLGQGQVRKHDVETWMPSRGSYGETHSCSTFYDFQTRRLEIKYKDQEGKRQLAYTLNNTACATPRLMLAVCENHQTQNGDICIPEALRPYLGGKSFISEIL